MDHNTRWNTYLTALRTYAEARGDAHVPAGFVYTADPDNSPLNLGAWVGYMRQRHRRGILPQERIDALEAIPGWSWGPLRPGPRTDTQRNAEILAMRSQGYSLQRIADTYNLSRQRIHQITKDTHNEQ